MHRLQTVAYVRERPRDDDAHGIVDERLLHLIDDLAFQDPLSALLYGHYLLSLKIGLARTPRVPRGSLKTVQMQGARREDSEAYDLYAAGRHEERNAADGPFSAIH
jgi:hypothetical protein